MKYLIMAAVTEPGIFGVYSTPAFVVMIVSLPNNKEGQMNTTISSALIGRMEKSPLFVVKKQL